MRVTCGNVDLHVAEDGDPSAPPILLLHGITSAGTTWGWLVPDLAERYRVLRLDFRGHGRSGRAPGAYTVDGYVADAVAALEQAAGRPCPVVGHSLGAGTAAALAQRRPELLTAVVLEDPPLGPTTPGEPLSLEGNALLDGFRLMRETIPQLQQSNVPPSTLAGMLASAPDTTRRSTFGEALVADAIEAMAGAMLDVDASVLDPVLTGTAGNFLDPRVPFGVPTLLLAADPANPDAIASVEAAQHYASISDDVQVVVMAGAGHLIHDEQRHRERFRDAVASFLDRVTTAA